MRAQALSASVTEEELCADNAAVGMVGEGTPFTILEGDALQPYLDALKAVQDAAPGARFPLYSPLRCNVVLCACSLEGKQVLHK